MKISERLLKKYLLSERETGRLLCVDQNIEDIPFGDTLSEIHQIRMRKIIAMSILMAETNYLPEGERENLTKRERAFFNSLFSCIHDYIDSIKTNNEYVGIEALESAVMASVNGFSFQHLMIKQALEIIKSNKTRKLERIEAILEPPFSELK